MPGGGVGGIEVGQKNLNFLFEVGCGGGGCSKYGVGVTKKLSFEVDEEF